jgi:uncharacterized protein with HEPN domain
MQHRDIQILNKIISEAEELAKLTDGYDLASFLADERTKRAVSMTLINVGELVKTVTDELRLANPQIPWKLVAGLRDVTAHRYQTLSMEDIWETVQTDIPALRIQLLALFN